MCLICVISYVILIRYRTIYMLKSPILLPYTIKIEGKTLKISRYLSLILIVCLFCQLFPSGNAEIRSELIEYPITPLLSIINNATNDQTVIVPSGEYIINERNARNGSSMGGLFYQVSINRSVNLIAEPGAEVIIRSEIGTAEIWLNAARIGFSGIRFTDVTFKIDGDPRSKKFNEVKLDHCIFNYSYDNYNRRIDNYNDQLVLTQLSSMDRCSITNCEFTRFTVSIYNVNETTISDSIFIDSRLSQGQVGRTEVLNNEFIGIGSGVTLYHIKYANIRMNNFRGCLSLPDVFVGYPIDVSSDGVSCDIKENVFVDCTFAIFFMPEADPNLASIRDNTFDNCTYGIFVYDQPKKEFREKNKFNNTDDPVYYEKGSGYNWFDHLSDNFFDENGENYSPYWCVVLICVLILSAVIVFLLLRYKKAHRTKKASHSKKKHR